MPIIHCIPTIDKNLDRAPGRPIVSGLNSIHARIGEYVDYYLQPIVMKNVGFPKRWQGCDKDFGRDGSGKIYYICHY